MDATKDGKGVLVLGGTGAMGVYLVESLLALEYRVDVVSLDAATSLRPRLRYIQADAKDDAFLRTLLKNNYDGIVDFLLYSTPQFQARYDLLLGNTDHYLYLSSYRVYADARGPIREDSSQLLDTSADAAFLATDDYALAKARQEDILENSAHRNYTIVRPAITYSKFRYQLVTLEANTIVQRARQNKAVVLPREALPIQATMTWAGDVAEMLARLLFNPKAARESYTTATAEHRTWGEIAGYYGEWIGLRVVPTDMETYLRLLGGGEISASMRWQLAYDRLYNRMVDNTKVLEATGLRQSDLTPLREGLRRELTALPADVAWPDREGINERMDRFLEGNQE